MESETGWLNVNKLQSSPSKIKLMVNRSEQNLINKKGNMDFSISMNNNSVEPVWSNKCLGDHLDDGLTFDIYIEEIGKKICLGIGGVLRRIRRFIHQSSLDTL